MILMRLFVIIVLAVSATCAYALTTEEREALEEKQVEPDRKCEEARDIALAPERAAIFNECTTAKYSTNTEEDCKQMAADYNGNRKDATPRFYELPACVEAFDHKRTQINNFKQ